MEQNKIIEYFMYNKGKNKSVREISKQLKTPVTTTQRHIKLLRSDKIIDGDNKLNYTINVKLKKMNFFLSKIISSGIVEHLIDEYNPTCIILFGSIQKGEYSEGSDIDLFIESENKNIPNLSKYEQILGHKLEIFIENDIKNLPNNLYNNVVNGIKLYGGFKAK